MTIKRLHAVVCVFLLASMVQAANPFSTVSVSKAKTDLKAELTTNFGANYTMIELMLGQGMAALTELKKIPGTPVNQKILIELKDVFYPNFTMILMMFHQNKSAYERLNKP